MTTELELASLADRVLEREGSDNSMDVLIEIALFEPDSEYTAIRANAAGTKVIYTRFDGVEHTFRADDWTMAREKAAQLLRARSIQGKE